MHVCQGSWQCQHLLAESGPSWQGRPKLCDGLGRATVDIKASVAHFNMATTSAYLCLYIRRCSPRRPFICFPVFSW
ncbi:hypothetical protein SRHO_G00283770 [Serrasalmus rhombeus]